MKSKGGGGLFGMFKKKTSPAPAAPVDAQEPGIREREEKEEKKNTSETTTTTTTVNASSSSSSSTDTQVEHVMEARKGSIAKTSVIHYSPPGTGTGMVRASSVISSGNSLEEAVVITRKSNIVLDDEESVISTPISQYDEDSIVQKQKPVSVSVSRKKRTQAPPPPPPSHYRQTSQTTTADSIPPVLPAHRNGNGNEKPKLAEERKIANGNDYEGMLKKLQTKFDEWNQVRMEDGGSGSMREERIKAEVLQEHEKLKVLLEKEVSKESNGKKSGMIASNNNNNNYVKLPQVTPKPPPKIYQKTKSASSSSNSKPLETPVHIRTRSTDENRNEIRYSYTNSEGKNSAAVDRLRKEVEEQRQREREVKQYRNPKSPTSPTSPGPRMVEYKPMSSMTMSNKDPDQPPPIPKTPPPKLAEYRKESPRMPTLPQNGYVRLQVGVKKAAAPVAPAPTTMVKKVPYGVPYTGPEFASSPKLLRKSPVTPQQEALQAQKPIVKEKEIVYQKPQQHPQIAYQKVATSPPPTNFIYQKSAKGAARITVNGTTPSPKMTRAVSQDATYQKTTVPPATSPSPVRAMTRAASQDVQPSKSNFIYQKSTISSSPSPSPSPRPQRSSVFPPNTVPTVSLSATSPVYQKITVVQVSNGAPPHPPPQPMTSPKPPRRTDPKPIVAGPMSDSFDISDVLKGPRLRKVGMPVEKTGISMGKVLDSAPPSSPSSRPSTIPPPPPPPIASGPKIGQVATGSGKSDLRDSLMNEIREAGRLRAARVSQNA